MSHTELDSLFPDDRMLGENELERGHRVLARMFHVFVYLCERYNIEWWTTGGTMLGKLRGEMLPWSGDIDICMQRDSLMEFMINCVPMLPRSIFFQSANTDPYLKSESTYNLRDRYSNYYEWAERFPSMRHHNGLQLNMFILDEGARGYPHPPWRAKDTFPLEKNSREVCEVLHGKDFMTIEKRNHSGKWHATLPCNHPESLVWEKGEELA